MKILSEINKSQVKRKIIEFAMMVIFYFAVKLIFEIVYSINLNEVVNQSNYDSGALVMKINYIRCTIELITVGLLYVFFNLVSKFDQRKIKSSFNFDKLLLWFLPCAILVGWHIAWLFFPKSFTVPYPPFYLTNSDFPIPHFQVLLLYIMGYMVLMPLSQEFVSRWRFLRPVVFFAVSIIATVMFQIFNGTAGYGTFTYGKIVSQYTFMGYIVAFAIYGGIGALFGFTYHIAGEIKKRGEWSIDWFRLVIWCASSFVLTIYDGIVYLDVEEGLIRYSSLLWMFIFGNTITTSFNKKDDIEKPFGISDNNEEDERVDT